MARTYLQLVNDVLTRLRESSVTTVAQTPYSALIGALINDAKREVEDAWQWSHLFDYFTFTTAKGTYKYETTGQTTNSGRTLGDRTRLWIDNVENVPLLVCTTSGFEARLAFEPMMLDFTNKLVMLNQGTNGQDIPSMWQIFPSTTNLSAGLWNKTINLFNIPNATRTYNCYVVNPQTDLVNDTDVMYVPYPSVVQKAYLFALYERGEELGEALTLTEKKLEDTLSNAIAQDQQISANYLQMAIPFGAKY